MVALGDSMLQDFLIASGSLSTIGGVRAFRIAFGVLPEDPGAILAMTHARGAAGHKEGMALQVLGVKAQSNTMSMMADSILAAAAFMKRQPKALALGMAEAVGITSIISPERLMVLREMSKKDLQEMKDMFDYYMPLTDIGETARKAFIRFVLVVRATGAQITSIIGNTLADPASPFTQAVTKLSQSLVHLFDAFTNIALKKENVDLLGKYIDELAEWMKKPGTDEKILKVSRIIKDIIKSIIEAIGLLKQIIQILRETTPTLIKFHGRRGLAQRLGMERPAGAPAIAPAPTISPGRRRFTERIKMPTPAYAPTITPGRKRFIERTHIPHPEAGVIPPGRAVIPPSRRGGATTVPAGRAETSYKGGAVPGIVTEEWRKAGMSDAGIAGVLANIRSESNFNPNLRHPDQPKFSGEAHFAHGLYQEGGTEWNNYEAWLNKNHPGSDWRDPRLQSRFAAENLKKNYPGVWERMNKGTKEQAAAAYVDGYLKPAPQYRQQRIQEYLRGIPGLDSYKDTPTAAPSAAKPGGTIVGGGKFSDPYGLGPSVNPRLLAAAKAGAAYLPEGYRVEISSGARSGEHVGAGPHLHGNAIDVRIIGPNGYISNRGDDPTGMYQRWAQGAQSWATKNDPALVAGTGRGTLGWGGAFDTSAGSGVADPMHLDVMGSRGLHHPGKQLRNLPLLPDPIDPSRGQTIQQSLTPAPTTKPQVPYSQSRFQPWPEQGAEPWDKSTGIHIRPGDQSDNPINNLKVDNRADDYIHEAKTNSFNDSGQSQQAPSEPVQDVTPLANLNYGQHRGSSRYRKGGIYEYGVDKPSSKYEDFRRSENVEDRRIQRANIRYSFGEKESQISRMVRLSEEFPASKLGAEAGMTDILRMEQKKTYSESSKMNLQNQINEYEKLNPKPEPMFSEPADL
jgi:hypothetical protein